MKQWIFDGIITVPIPKWCFDCDNSMTRRSNIILPVPLWWCGLWWHHFDVETITSNLQYRWYHVDDINSQNHNKKSTVVTACCQDTVAPQHYYFSSYIMKFASLSTYALLVAFSPNASSFVPNAARPPASTSISTISFNDVIHASAAARPSSELNLFGSRWRKTRKINSQSGAGKPPITESEVRGLFELWNSALATGDSRIVASRYTKVRRIRCSLFAIAAVI